MERVLGLGGVFWRSDDPDHLAAWYESRLGVEGVPAEYGGPTWRQSGGVTVFAPFKRDTSHFASERQQVMFNFRVRNLDAFVAQLRGQGEEVTVDPEAYPNGRFARLHDPEGNAVELWEPSGADGEAEEHRGRA